MSKAKLRTILIAAIAAIGVASAIPAASQAKTVHRVGATKGAHAHDRASHAQQTSGGSKQSSSVTTSARLVNRAGTLGGLKVIISKGGFAAKPVEAGSTGDGYADDRQCQGYANTINFLLDEAQDELNEHGNGADFDMLVDDAKYQQEVAEDAGCFIVNPV